MTVEANIETSSATIVHNAEVDAEKRPRSAMPTKQATSETDSGKKRQKLRAATKIFEKPGASRSRNPRSTLTYSTTLSTAFSRYKVPNAWGTFITYIRGTAVIRQMFIARSEPNTSKSRPSANSFTRIR